MGLNGVAIATGIGWIWLNFFWWIIKKFPKKGVDKLEFSAKMNHKKTDEEE